MNKFLLIIITTLIGVILFLSMCNKKPDSTIIEGKPIIIERHDTIKKTLLIYKTDSVPKPGDTVFIPDTNYNVLKRQYLILAGKYSNRNIYSDSIPIDSFGYVKIIDTVEYNTLLPRTYISNYKIPIRQFPITPTKNQVYIGGGINTTYPINIRLIHGDILLKTKKDIIYGASIGLDTALNLNYGISMYYKIKTKK